MKRRRRGGATQQAEACDIWLDTAELKQSAAQSLIAKPKVPSRVLEWKQASVIFTQPRASQPRTKQTTISAFFSTQTDEKDKENSRPSPFIPNKGCKEKAPPLAACPVKILALSQEEAQKCPLGAFEQPVQVTAQRAPASPAPLRDSSLLPAGSRSTSGASCRAGGDSCSSSFTQDSEGNRVIAHPKEAKLLAGETAPAGNQNKKPQQSSGVNSSIDFAATENINPAVRTDGTWAAGFCSGAQPLREHSWNAGLGSPCRQLFTQDSQGNRVIAHGSIPAAGTGCSSRAAPRRPRHPGEQQGEVGFEFLFTQDSEGNRVIKHW